MLTMIESSKMPAPRYTVSQYLDFYENKKTKGNYQNAISLFLSTIYSTTSSDVSELDIFAANYLDQINNNGRNPLADLRIAANIFKNRYSPLTTHLNLTLICAWLEFCGVPMQKRERQRIFSTLPPARPSRKEAELTRTMFKKIHSKLPDDMGVLLLVLLGSGMRIGEALSLQTSDLDFKLKRAAIHIRAETTKTKTARTVYLTDEAAKALKEYLSRRTYDDRVFPFSQALAQYYFRKATDKAGYGKKGNNPRLIHWHMTRKWFISRFSLYASKEVAEELAGHEGYLSQSYQRFTRKQILFQFKRADKYLSLFTDSKPPTTSPNTDAQQDIGIDTSDPQTHNIYKLVHEIASLKQRMRVRKRDLIRRRESAWGDEILMQIDNQIDEKMIEINAAIVSTAKRIINDGRQPAVITTPEVQAVLFRYAEQNGVKFWRSKRMIPHITATLKKGGFVPVSLDDCGNGHKCGYLELKQHAEKITE